MKNLVSFVVVAILLSANLVQSQDASFRMPVYPDKDPPPARNSSEVEKLLAGSKTVQDKALNVLLVAGAKDHGKGEHDYPNWQIVWQRMLPQAKNPTHVDTAMEFPTQEQIDAADVMVFYQRGKWDDERATAIDAFLARGGGLVYIHWAVDGRGQQEEMAKRIGLASLGGGIRVRHGELDIDFSPGREHPIARNFQRIRWIDESYWQLTGDPNRLNLIGTSLEDGAPQPQFWTMERGRGRVFVSIPGHYMWTFDDPAFRALLFRGIAWVAQRPVDRFNDLVTLDARIE